MPNVPVLDGDGWVECSLGHRHWGRYGAAGLLLHTLDAGGETMVLLQHRAWWTHHGNTWGVPGGARTSSETAEQTALRETGEEVVVDLTGLVLERVHEDDHGGWGYSTVIARLAAARPAASAGRETASVRWVTLSELDRLDLHPGLATTWPQLLPDLAS